MMPLEMYPSAERSCCIGWLDWFVDVNVVTDAIVSCRRLDCEPAGFDWIDADDAANSVFTFMRRGRTEDDILLAVFNCTSVPRDDYELGVPAAGTWLELLNTDSEHFGGSGAGNLGRVETEPRSSRDQPHTLKLLLPPLGALLLAPARREGRA